MLDFSNTDIAGPEIRYGREERDRVLALYRKQKNGYTSGFWKNSGGFSEETGEYRENPENLYFEFVALMKPRLAANTPVVDATTSRAGPAERMAIAVKHAINRWLVDTKYGNVMGTACIDYLFNHCVLHVSMVENNFLGGDGKEINAQWPEVNRISQWDFFVDPSAKSRELTRYLGHDELMDKDDAISRAEDENKEDADWDIEAIESIAAGESDDESQMGQPLRNQILITTVWVRGYEGKNHPGEKERCYGTIFTFGSGVGKDDHDLRLIHEPEPFYGPPSGPYHYASAYTVPDSPWGVSALTANEGQIQDVNKHARAVSRSSEKHKVGVAVDNTDPNFAAKVRDFEDHSVLEVSGLTRDAIIPFVINGVHPEAVNYLMLTKDRADRSLGISEAMRGVATGDATATESSLAGAAGDVRIAGIRSPFVALNEAVISAAAWYMIESEEFKIELPPEANDELEMPGGAIQFKGGKDKKKPEEDVRPEDLEIKIELLSMEHTSEPVKQRRAALGHQIIMEVSAIAMNAPWVNWERHIKTMGDANGIVRLEDEWDQDMFEAMVSRNLQMEFNHQQQEGEARLKSHPGPKAEVKQPVPMPFQQPQQSAFAPPGAEGASAGAAANAGAPTPALGAV